MGINVVWGNEEKTALHWIYDGRWTWDDFGKASKQGAELAGQVTHKVAVVMDIRAAKIIPDGTISSAKRALMLPRHPNLSITVVVGANAFAKSLTNAVLTISRTKAENWPIQFATTMEEANALVKPHSAEAKPSGTKPPESAVSEPKPSEPKLPDTTVSETKVSEAKPSDTHTPELKPSEPTASDTNAKPNAQTVKS